LPIQLVPFVSAASLQQDTKMNSNGVVDISSDDFESDSFFAFHPTHANFSPSASRNVTPATPHSLPITPKPGLRPPSPPVPLPNTPASFISTVRSLSPLSFTSPSTLSAPSLTSNINIAPVQPPSPLAAAIATRPEKMPSPELSPITIADSIVSASTHKDTVWTPRDVEHEMTTKIQLTPAIRTRIAASAAGDENSHRGYVTARSQSRPRTPLQDLSTELTFSNTSGFSKQTISSMGTDIFRKTAHEIDDEAQRTDRTDRSHKLELLTDRTDASGRRSARLNELTLDYALSARTASPRRLLWQ